MSDAPAKNAQPESKALSAAKNCLACNRENVELKEIPLATLHFLEKHSLLEKEITHVCSHCLNEFEGFKKNPGSYLVKKKEEMLEKRSRWVNRASVIKTAYQNFRSKNYDEAKGFYLDYIKTIEMCLGAPLREINASMFTKTGRGEELGPFTLSLWDLVVITDKAGSPASEELTLFANKFVEMARENLSRKIIVHTIKKYRREAKNKKLFKQMLLDLGVNAGCFIASCVYEDSYCAEVMRLRSFRDQYLMPHFVGRQVVLIYYRSSPILVRWITKRQIVKKSLRFLFSIFLR